MDAKEAREKAGSISNSKAEKQYIDVQNFIETAVKNCAYETYYYHALLPAVELKLREEGFMISSYYDQRDGTTVTIKW